MKVTTSDIQRILNAEDIEGLLELGAPPDEYSQEAETIAATLRQDTRVVISEESLTTIILDAWARWFGPLSDDDLRRRSPAFRNVARRILREAQQASKQTP